MDSRENKVMLMTTNHDLAGAYAEQSSSSRKMLTTIEMKKAAIQGAQFLDAAGDLIEVKVGLRCGMEYCKRMDSVQTARRWHVCQLATPTVTT